MNEKINSIRLDAGISTLQDDPRLVVINKKGEVIDPMIGLEKFAELIIKESLEVMNEFNFNGEWLGKKIKEHFGIE